MSDAPAVVLVDREGVIEYWSTGAERLFGYTAASAVGQTLNLIVPEDYRKRHWSGFQAAMETGKTKLDQPAASLAVLCADGRVERFPSRLLYLRDARGRGIGAMGIFVRDDGSGPALPNV